MPTWNGVGVHALGTASLVHEHVAAALQGRGDVQARGVAVWWRGVEERRRAGALQFSITCCEAAAYIVASGWIAARARRPMRFGSLYGLAVYAVVFRIVLPAPRAVPTAR